MSVYEDEFGPMELDSEERRVLLELLDVESAALDGHRRKFGNYSRRHDDPNAIGWGSAFSWPGRMQ